MFWSKLLISTRIIAWNLSSRLLCVCQRAILEDWGYNLTPAYIASYVYWGRAHLRIPSLRKRSILKAAEFSVRTVLLSFKFCFYRFMAQARRAHGPNLVEKKKKNTRTRNHTERKNEATEDVHYMTSCLGDRKQAIWQSFDRRQKMKVLKGQRPDCAHAQASSVFSSKDNWTVILTRQDFLPDHTADGDLLFKILK